MFDMIGGVGVGLEVLRNCWRDGGLGGDGVIQLNVNDRTSC